MLLGSVVMYRRIGHLFTTRVQGKGQLARPAPSMFLVSSHARLTHDSLMILEIIDPDNGQIFPPLVY